MEKSLRELCQFQTHLHYLIVKENPVAMALDDGDVMAAVGPAARRGREGGEDEQQECDASTLVHT